MTTVAPPEGRVRGLHRVALATFVTLLLVVAAGAGAESLLEIPYPKNFGEIPASTYDLDLNRIGDAEIQIEVLESGNVLFRVRSGEEGGAGNQIEAEFEKLGSPEAPVLRVIRERSQSFDPTGKALPILEIDHRKGEASCTPASGESERAEVIPLPDEDRVANVPLNLLFEPLVRGEVERLEFDVFLCLGGPRFMRFVARARDLEPSSADAPHRLRQVSYEPDLGAVFSWVAKKVGPTVLFWFDQTRDGLYVAHRMPLYSRGPEVLIVRDDFPISALADHRSRN